MYSVSTSNLSNTGADTGFNEGGGQVFYRSAEKIFRLHFPVVGMGCRGTFVVCTASSRCARIDAAYAERRRAAIDLVDTCMVRAGRRL